MLSYPLMSLKDVVVGNVFNPISSATSLSSSLTVEGNAAVSTRSRKPFCLGGLWDPLRTPDCLLGLRKSRDTGLGFHRPDLGLAGK
jgi:hypothetical protein